jgi:hypothetical protein
VPSVPPQVTASKDGGAPQHLRQFALSPGHYVDFVVVAPGTWRFSVTTSLHHRRVSFGATRKVTQ